MTQQQQLLTIILPTESLEAAAAHEKPESLTHQEYCVLSGFYPPQGSNNPPTFYREATLRGVIEPGEATSRYLNALRERGIIFGYRIDSVAQCDDLPPMILPEDIILSALDSEIPGSARAELAFDPSGFAYAEEPSAEAKSVGFLWEAYGQKIIDHIAKRAVQAERTRVGKEEAMIPVSSGDSTGKKFWRVEYNHPQIGRDDCLSVGCNEEEAIAQFRENHGDDYELLSIALEVA